MPLRFWRKDKSAPSDGAKLSHHRILVENGTMGQRCSRIWRWEKSPPTYHQSQHSQSQVQIEREHDQNLWTPPPYSALPVAPSYKTTCYTSVEDSPLALLGEFDTILVVDDSSSMIGSRWAEVEKALAAFAPVIAQYNKNGIDMYFLNHRNPSTESTTGAYTNITTGSVEHIFNSFHPRGTTPVGKRLSQILRPYLQRVEKMAAATNFDGVLTDPTLFVKPLNIIAITDGEFTDDAESIIIDTAKTLDRCRTVPWQVGIQFCQVGTDAAAAQYLRMLDDDLGKLARDGDLRDIVDTVPWKGQRRQTLNAEGLKKCILGAVNKKYDRLDAFR